jgi:DNA polymerase elongation subunit (family B)
MFAKMLSKLYIILNIILFLKINIRNKRGIMIGKNFRVIDLGVKEAEVYDIEVEKTHNFYGNNILLHNSNYICLEEIIEKLKLKFDNQKEFYLWCKDFIKEVIQPLGEMAMNLYEKNFDQKYRIELELEKIISSAFIVGKKHYVLGVIEDDKGYYEEPKFKNTGIETKKRNTPVFVKTSLTEVLKMILRNMGKEDIIDYMREQKKVEN